MGPERPTRGKVRVEIRDEPGGTRLRAPCLTPDRLPLEVDLLVQRPEGHESLSVVVPWSQRRFRYASEHTALPATGRVRTGTETLGFGGDDGEAWAVLDHGRGRWPRTADWKCGAASGRTDGHTVGLQFGGRCTEGTGSAENGLCVVSRPTGIGEEPEWRWPASDPHRSDRQPHRPVLRHYDGRIRTDAGTEIPVQGLLGWAEDVHIRW
ncbi:DUF2804 family protein [Streptomyces mutabilis]|uniref:DUF2804 family protein n=1 Tax=Streptomyces mutabilis TaxID=67332 RepID=UPI0019C306C0|nr:DUF2804 family protein [Streptomyces mutabilis]GGQ16798.1 hypothetical protein GCM10010279_25690 [Streptomyces mutabilis]